MSRIENNRINLEKEGRPLYRSKQARRSQVKIDKDNERGHAAPDILSGVATLLNYLSGRINNRCKINNGVVLQQVNVKVPDVSAI